MPTSLPWAVPTSLGLVHPTVLYSCIVALIVLAVSLRQIHQPHRKGFVFARGLWIAGIGGYLRQLVTQPANPTGHTLLEPRQIAAVVFLAIGLSAELPTLLRRLRSTPQPHLAEIVAINRAA
jgi:prolipoprotein diacylglyceryltransferase